jgi:hypothetical protein
MFKLNRMHGEWIETYKKMLQTCTFGTGCIRA